MITPSKILSVLLLAGVALLSFAACNLITPPSLGQTEPAASPPAGSGSAGSAPIPTATLISGSASGGAGAPTPAVLVSGGRSMKQWSTAPPVTIDTSASYTAVLHTTAGDITVDLLTSDAPNTVNNFVFLAREGFYDNAIFHRTIPGFMIQGGDPTGTGSGGPGYRFADEPVNRPYSRGVMAMANAGPNTNGSQFFLMHADYALPPSYTIFGQTVAGVETIDNIATAPTHPGGQGSSPVNPVAIQSVEIVGP
ncbi:Peptidyl-prolyl cis-trans isomerase-like 3 [Geodia barretti]|uniref:Peptidyl-prolyl cis-trans isomerase n=1 Tax=Geodia barretti TaxID=519541 RepID=A0AA35W523_GEOBA|nr:Peptidyl-prolyl cis-trans isomerase-like 3 [Geodia barretti]